MNDYAVLKDDLRAALREFRRPRRAPAVRPRADRFWTFVERGDGCWLWTGALGGRGGYGRFDADRAHRVAYELVVGPIPPGLFVCHHCDVPRCVRPDHLFVGTAKDNAQDRDRKGRRRGPVGPRRPRTS